MAAYLRARCKIGARNRLPASFFVSVAYMCWAYRRRGVVLDREGDVVEWLYTAPEETFDLNPAAAVSGLESLIDLGVSGRSAPTSSTLCAWRTASSSRSMVRNMETILIVVTTKFERTGGTRKAIA